MPTNYSRRIQFDNQFRFWISVFVSAICFLLNAEGPSSSLFWIAALLLAYNAVVGVFQFLSTKLSLNYLAHYFLMAVDCVAITGAIHLSGGNKSPLYILYIVLFGMCVYHRSVANFVYSVVLSYIFYAGLLIHYEIHFNLAFPTVFAHVILLAFLTGVLYAILFLASRDWQEKTHLIRRAKALAKIADILGGTTSDLHDKIRVVSQIMTEDACANKIQARIFLHKTSQRFVPASGRETGIHVPIAAGEKIFGLLVLNKEGDAALTPDEMDFFTSVSRFIGTALYRDQLWKDFQKQLRKAEASILLNEPPTPAPMNHEIYGERLVIENMSVKIQRERGKWAVQKEACDLNALLSEGLKPIRFLAAKKQQIMTVVCSEEKASIVPVDREKVKKLLDNALYNAVGATPEKGEIVISMGTSNSDVVLSIQDQGAPLNPREMDLIANESGGVHLYDENGSFTKRELGILVCKDIIAGHGGKMTVEPDPAGKGNIWIFSLPLQESGRRAVLQGV